MKNLKKLRKAHYLSQKQLAEYLHLSQQSVWKYENGVAEPDFQTLIGFSKLFHTSVDYLIGNVDEKEEFPQWNLEVTDEEKMTCFCTAAHPEKCRNRWISFSWNAPGRCRILPNRKTDRGVPCESVKTPLKNMPSGSSLPGGHVSFLFPTA